ncbi:phosphate ABC transporter substrate-binding protein PstS [candidate division WOR-1 bacterium RIFOXYB2_FULL_42_35]|uniref:Phosphate-binding protein n=1 Tax=candidate division WOR-1 bacterium RIFOXYC2_FULL_41_25 TaxID=1802586 RepID=A0A1F4TMH5_UNCSA|nr:MAG: phosphate ABC transporter substrate-binding protein PstS [candidate division WOR-1 bacterium RIFOXYA2_FULL_41_14]OGC23894.1 MAG: phosphate ABC transporter substrate-binding protein PstS [candidate division WOR-1 bacterium RIFOXYB2_FULL_42_35]OGC33769.1 MAG: phosphate ABC transporter substrate-binding protein PstS [candidate division WOR-1 bacterium RIFOXYC2_FULL_41_25]OGC44192.1 MAG: phosphate ABC transporter substrate-binding protein PstS [candidate division WOR-1 bacterium RIFOXYD2_FUL
MVGNFYKGGKEMFKKLGVLMLASVLLIGMAAAANLNGAGATFPYPLYMKWNNVYAKETGVKVNYQGIGSGGGQRQFIAGITDFGGSDAPMTDKQINSAGGDVLHIPTVMGAVAVSYNLSGVGSLNLDADTLAGIFLGKIKKWNQVDSSFPDKDIIVCHRSDGSGTTDIFTSYLAKVSLDWASKVGAGNAVAWPVGLGGKGNAGVAGLIKVNDGSIGYVELSYAIENKLTVAALKNKAGIYVVPSLDSTSAAADGALNSKKVKQLIASGDFRLDLTNALGARSYPIVGMTWLLVHKKQADAKKGQALVDYLKWVLNDGQQYAPELLYAPLPQNIKSKVLAVVEGIKI